jgi:hypothetical protein
MRKAVDVLFCFAFASGRSEPTASLVGRDHLAFRSAQLPAKGVVDLDYLATLPFLPWERQTQVADALGTTPPIVARAIGELLDRL